jgi:chaperonin cofactor prefoldin
MSEWQATRIITEKLASGKANFDKNSQRALGKIISGRLSLQKTPPVKSKSWRYILPVSLLVLAGGLMWAYWRMETHGSAEIEIPTRDTLPEEPDHQRSRPELASIDSMPVDAPAELDSLQDRIDQLEGSAAELERQKRLHNHQLSQARFALEAALRAKEAVYAKKFLFQKPKRDKARRDADNEVFKQAARLKEIKNSIALLEARQKKISADLKRQQARLSGLENQASGSGQ